MTVTAAASASVAVTGVELNKTSDTILVGGTTALTATVSPSDATNQNVSWASDNTAVATVDANGVVTGVTAGTANITVTAEDGAYTASCAVTVNESTKNNAANITLSLTNAYSDDDAWYVLVGTNANLSVTVTDENGNAVANAPVVLTSKEIAEISSGYTEAYKNSQQNLTDTVVYTDENGTATFVYGSKNSKDDDGAVDALRTDYVASYAVTAAVAGSGVSSEFDLGFAAISLSGVSKKNPDNSSSRYVVGTNAGSDSGLRTTTGANGEAEEYIYSQQVSASDSDAHAVTFESSATLTVPSTETKSNASNIEKEVNYTSGSYTIYGETEGYTVMDEVTVDELQYASVYFTDFDLSEYAKFEAEAYLTDDPSDPANHNKGTIETKTIKGDDVSTGAWTWQIPLSAQNGEYYLVVSYKITSQGQVNTAHNSGFSVSKIVGVKNSSTTKKSNSGSVNDVTITWAKDSGSTWTDAVSVSENASDKYVYTVSGVEIDVNDIITKINSEGYDVSNVKVQVPAFPRTGNALFTVYDANGNVQAYYTAATINGKSVDENKLTNVNVVSTSGTVVCYKISETEAKNETGDVTDNGDGTVTVNATATGATHLVATITSTNDAIEIDASNEHLYTSVQWNPIPNAGTTTTDNSKTVAALVSQTATVVAQLVDSNGNAVSENGNEIGFYTSDLGDGATKLTAGATIGDATVVSISNSGKTDANGQVTLTLTSNAIETINKLTATSSNYNVKFTVGNVSADSLNVMWIDTNIVFTDSAYDGTKYSTSLNETEKTATTTYNVGETWVNGVTIRWKGEAPGATYDWNTLEGYFTRGVTSVMSVGDGSVGTADKTTANQMTVTSTAAGSAVEQFSLTKDSYSDDIGIYCDTDNISWWTYFSWNYGEIAYVGSGAVDNDKTLKLNATWEASGVSAKFVLPTGSNAALGTDKVGYLRLIDQYGNAVTEGKEVTLTVAGTGIVSGASIKAGGDVANDGTVNATGSAMTVTTGNCGLVKFTLAGLDSAGSATVTATVAGTSISVYTTFKWKDVSTNFAVESAAYSSTDRTLTLTFNQELVDAVTATTVGSITFTDTATSSERTYTPESVVISGKKLIITMPNGITSQSISDETSFSFTAAEWINYDESDETGDSVTYTIASAETGQVLEGTFTVIADGGKTSDGKVKFSATK